MTDHTDQAIAQALDAHEAAYHPGQPCPEDQNGQCAARRAAIAPYDAGSFATYITATDRATLDAKAATAEAERDEALDDRDLWKRSAENRLSDLVKARDEISRQDREFDRAIRERDEASADLKRATDALQDARYTIDQRQAELERITAALQLRTTERDAALTTLMRFPIGTSAAVLGSQARAQGAEIDPERLAELFHTTYERLAPSFGYETRKASAKPWAEVPEQNRALMVAVCTSLLGWLRRGAPGGGPACGKAGAPSAAAAAAPTVGDAADGAQETAQAAARRIEALRVAHASTACCNATGYCGIDDCRADASYGNGLAAAVDALTEDAPTGRQEALQRLVCAAKAWRLWYGDRYRPTYSSAQNDLAAAVDALPPADDWPLPLTEIEDAEAAGLVVRPESPAAVDALGEGQP